MSKKRSIINKKALALTSEGLNNNLSSLFSEDNTTTLALTSKGFKNVTS